MDFSPDVLREHAQRRVDQEVKERRGIVGAYLRGSLIYGSPLLGGAGDIDLVFIHSGAPDTLREIDPLTQQIHFDLAHHDQGLYQDTQALRVDPWLGPSLHDAIPLYDPRHFIDYTQSGVRSNFSTPENVLRRARKLLESARAFWFQNQLNPPPGTAAQIHAALEATHQAVNALAVLHGPPLASRRLGLELFSRADAAGAPHLYAEFIHLLGGGTVDTGHLREWLPAWQETVSEAPLPSHSHGLHPQQTPYYQSALQALLESDRPLSGLWVLLYTGAQTLTRMEPGTAGDNAWKEIWRHTGWWEDQFADKLDDFDALLDHIDQAISTWADTRAGTLP